MNTGEWKNDPRLANMDPVKLQYIETLAKQLSSQSKEQLLPALLSLQADAKKNRISFTDAETELLVSIITANMPPDEKKKIEMLHILAKKMAGKLTDALNCDGFNIVQNNGEIAGQTVFHFHMHLIPRYKGDEVGLTWKAGELSDEVRDEILKKVRD